MRKLARKLQISARSVHRILRQDLRCKPYKVVREPRLTEEQKRRRVKFANWVRNNFSKAETMRFVFSDEKLFTVDGVYNRQNERIWAVSRAEADKRGGRRQFDKFPGKLMVFLAICSSVISRVIFFDNKSVSHENYIELALPASRNLGWKHFGNNWTFQQDGAREHTAVLTQQWCTNNMPSFIRKYRWLSNSPDLNPPDYSV